MSQSKRKAHAAAPAIHPNLPSWRRFALMFVGALLVVAVAAWAWLRGSSPEPRPSEPPAHQLAVQPGPAGDAQVFSGYAGSPSCRECHAALYDKWSSSHHARAERAVDAKLDGAAFDPPRTIVHGTQTSQVRLREGRLEVETMGADGKPAAFEAVRVIGVDPLVQYLFAEKGGRWQVGELSLDPRNNEWFDVYGNEDRRAGEWGHWTGRGMNWNFMCGSCHNTRFRRNYAADTDSYATSMVEPGVGCESCHGPLAAHVAWQKQRGGAAKQDPTLKRLDKNTMFDACGSCHARRSELTGEFAAGEQFFDHYRLSIPDETDLFYPDGQIREEDYEFTSFQSSKMFAAGVRCVDCHEPHSSKTQKTGDALCMSCHELPVAPAPKIDPLAHGHHAAGSAGSHCVDCHMPQTTYMQRHARHDHGFTIPDPLLTRELGIPNACDRCHAERGVDWAIEAVERWYGTRMERPTRARARVVAAARAGQARDPASLVQLLAQEKVPLWRASAAHLLRAWNQNAAVQDALLVAASDSEPLVRANVARALEGLAQPPYAALEAALQKLSSDPSRCVRVEAAWSLRERLDPASLAGRDLLVSLQQGLDQPTGQHQMGLWHFSRGELADAIALFRRAVEWDANSPEFRHTLAVALSTQGAIAEAVTQLEAACRLAPEEAQYRYMLGLALSEAGKAAEARAALEQAVLLDPRLAAAWYNLGLARAEAQELEGAAEALTKAEGCEPNRARAPYALATVLARLGRIEEARAAGRRALEVDPNSADAANLLRALER